MNRYVQVDPVTGCHNWTGVRLPKGYGRLFVGMADGKPVRTYSHRWAYEQRHGPIPEGLHIDHLCRNPSCCNPDHLEAVTPRENILRGDHALKSHCRAGHELTAANTLAERPGWKRCRECHRTWMRESYRRKTAKARTCTSP